MLSVAAKRKRPRIGTVAPKGTRKATAKAPKRKKGAKRGAASANGAGPAVPEPALVKKREDLSRRFAELQWDLGGMAYEMASRDHYRLDVLNKQAAELQQVDAELGNIERMLKLEEQGAASTCPSCSALQARGAVFCWQCGNELKPPTDSKPKAAAKPRKANTKK